MPKFRISGLLNAFLAAAKLATCLIAVRHVSGQAPLQLENKTGFFKVFQFVDAVPLAEFSEPGGFEKAMVNSTFRIEGGQSSGTAFILGRPCGRFQAMGCFVLFSAVHVLSKNITDTIGILMPVRTGSGAHLLLNVPLPIRSRGEPLWAGIPGSDVAALPLEFLPEGALQFVISTAFLATERDIDALELGQDLLVLGFPRATAGPRGRPFLRKGALASTTPVPGKNTLAVSFPAQPGDSGGPVFVSLRMNNTYSGRIIGMMVESVTGRTDGEPIGVGLFVPSPEIGGVLRKLSMPGEQSSISQPRGDR